MMFKRESFSNFPVAVTSPDAREGFYIGKESVC